MSTRIQDDTAATDSLDVIGLEDSVEFRAVEVRNKNESSHTWVSVSTADLLAALRTEGILPAEPDLLASPSEKIVPADAIVILRETLPEVEKEISERTLRYVAGLSTWTYAVDPFSGADVTSDDVRRNALAYLALAEYLDANPPKPPVDEAMVRGIALAVTNPHTQQRDDETGIQYARRLYLAGVRIEASK